MTTNKFTTAASGISRLEGQKGLSLMEMGIAATVLAALILGAMMGIQKLNFDRQMTEARKQIPVTISAAVDAFSTQQNTSSLNTAKTGTRVMSSFNVWPDNRVKDKGLESVMVTGPFPGSHEYLMTNTTSAIPRLRQINQGFAYWITNIPDDACMPLLQTLITNRSVASIHVGPAALKPTGTTTGTTNVGTYATNGSLTLNTTTASTACSGRGNRTLLALIART
jgi:hypothetical protein